MKIMDKRENRRCILAVVWKGETFVIQKEDCLVPYLHAGLDDDNLDVIKAVNLKNGDIELVDKSTLVEPVELTIEVYSRST